MKHLWTGNHERNNFYVSISHDTEDLQEVIELFECYLRGCGYIFSGNIGIVETDKE